MQQRNTQELISKLIDKLNFFQVEKVITSSADAKFELKKRIETLEKQIAELKKKLTEGAELTDSRPYQSLFEILEAEPQKLDIEKFDKVSKTVIKDSQNVISNSTINAGGNVHIGNITNNYYNSESKKQDETMADKQTNNMNLEDFKKHLKNLVDEKKSSEYFEEIESSNFDYNKSTFNHLRNQFNHGGTGYEFSDRLKSFAGTITKK